MYKESEPLSDLASAFERDGGAEPLEVRGWEVVCLAGTCDTIMCFGLCVGCARREQAWQLH